MAWGSPPCILGNGALLAIDETPARSKCATKINVPSYAPKMMGNIFY